MDLVSLYNELETLSKQEQKSRLLQLEKHDFCHLTELNAMLLIDDHPLSGSQLLTQSIPKSDDVDPTMFLGQMLMGFTIVKLIANSGGMGLIFQGEQRIACPETNVETIHKAAIKIVRSTQLNSSQKRALFFSEASMLMTLEHPNVCSIYGVSEVLGHSCIVMDFIDGVPLDVWVSQQPHNKNSKSKHEGLKIFKQVLGAMSYLHCRDVFHGDIKPQNIMVTDLGRVVLIDLGLAFKKQVDGTKAIGTDIKAFSRHWSAPEQIMGQDRSAKSDVYSLGIVLNYLLTGYADVTENRVKQPELNALINKAIAKDPTKRFMNAADFMTRIDAYSEGLPIDEYSKHRVYQLIKLLRRKPFTCLTSALVIYSIFTSLWIILH